MTVNSVWIWNFGGVFLKSTYWHLFSFCRQHFKVGLALRSEIRSASFFYNLSIVVAVRDVPGGKHLGWIFYTPAAAAAVAAAVSLRHFIDGLLWAIGRRSSAATHAQPSYEATSQPRPILRLHEIVGASRLHVQYCTVCMSQTLFLSRRLFLSENIRNFFLNFN